MMLTAMLTGAAAADLALARMPGCDLEVDEQLGHPVCFLVGSDGVPVTVVWMVEGDGRVHYRDLGAMLGLTPLRDPPRLHEDDGGDDEE